MPPVRPPSRRRKGPYDPTRVTSQSGKKLAMALLWDGQGEGSHLGGEQPLAEAIAMGGTLKVALLMSCGAVGSQNLDLQQVLETTSHDLRDQGPNNVSSMSWFGS